MRLLAVGRSVVVRIAAVENHLAAAHDQQAVDQRKLRRRDIRVEGRQWLPRLSRAIRAWCETGSAATGAAAAVSHPASCSEEYDPSKGSRSGRLPQVGLLHLLTPKVKLS